MSKVLTYLRGSIVYFQGSVSDKVFILQKGKLVSETSRVFSRKSVQHVIKAGEFFGLREILGGYPRLTSVTAVEDSVCIAMDAEEFENLILTKESLKNNIFSSFSKTLRKEYDEICSKSFLQKSESGRKMIEIASSFFNEGSFGTCFEISRVYESLVESEAEKKVLDDLKKRAEVEYENNVNSKKSPIEQFRIENDIKSNEEIEFYIPPAELASHLQIYDKGEIICAELETSGKFYCIQSGEVYICKCVEGKNCYMGVAVPGEFIGTVSMIDKTSSPVTYIARKMVKVLEFDKTDFENLFANNQKMAYKLLKVLAKRVFQQEIFNNVHLCISNSDKLLAFLYLYASHIERNSKIDSYTENDDYVKNRLTSHSKQIHISSPEISAWLCISENEVQKELKSLVLNNHIIVEKNRIVILNMKNLLAMGMK